MDVEAFELKLCSGGRWDSSEGVNLESFHYGLKSWDFKCINTI